MKTNPIRPTIVLVLSAASCSACVSDAASHEAEARWRLEISEQDPTLVDALRAHLDDGIRTVERFFGAPFERPFVVEVFPNRSAFDGFFRTRWGIEHTEAWMVAAGVADRLVLLSPAVWRTEAVEHDPDAAEHVRDLLAHELVHVYHGQKNPRPDFDGLDEIGWFVEGLATYASGQLERSHRDAASEALEAGKAPERLGEAWSGRYRYGVSGSLVEFIDLEYGRETLVVLLGATSQQEILRTLGLTEEELLAAWRRSTVQR